jgi:phenylalanyl-tRNA synthetase alpha subunit
MAGNSRAQSKRMAIMKGKIHSKEINLQGEINKLTHLRHNKIHPSSEMSDTFMRNNQYRSTHTREVMLPINTAGSDADDPVLFKVRNSSLSLVLILPFVVATLKA